MGIGKDELERLLSKPLTVRRKAVRFIGRYCFIGNLPYGKIRSFFAGLAAGAVRITG